MSDTTPTDVLRSMKRYVSVALGEEWEVRIADDVGTFKRPYALVSLVGPAFPSGGAAVRDFTQAMAIDVFPTLGASQEESLLLCLAARDWLDQAFFRGVDNGRPDRVPLYDYDGVSALDTVDTRDPHAFLRVTDYSSEVGVDVDDARLLIVNADVRLAWRRVGALSSTQRPLKGVTVEELP